MTGFSGNSSSRRRSSAAPRPRGARALAVVSALLMQTACVVINPIYTEPGLGSDSDGDGEPVRGGTTGGGDGSTTTGGLEESTGWSGETTTSSSSSTTAGTTSAVTSASTDAGATAMATSEGVTWEPSTSTGLEGTSTGDGAGTSTGDGCDDVDGDGVCYEDDNCPEDPNPQQLDGDEDGAGDVCDVCKGVLWDDNADYDGDGLVCGEDLCNLDGPDAMELAGSIGPVNEISFANISVNGSGEPFTFVAPNSPVTLTFDFEIASCGCPGCINQGIVALANTTPTQCFYDDVPGCMVAAGPSQHSFPAPSEPGTYFFHFTRMWNFSCAEVQNQPIGGAPHFAAICVTP